MPPSTDARIEAIIRKIRNLCARSSSSEIEAQLRELARELRSVINEHIVMAQDSLGTKAAAIKQHDPDFETKPETKKNQPPSGL
jgi:hypothetical protein